MDPIKFNKGPKEAKIQKDIIDHLKIRDWYVVHTHGNAYQCGFPDLFCCHQSYGIRWIEVKQPTKYAFTKSQLNVFTKFASKNLGVWVLTDKNQYDCLFRDANWHTYLMKSNGITLKATERIPKKGPEAVIQNRLIDLLTLEDWFCIETYGSIFQSGLPDIFAVHKEYGCKWIECKNPKKYSFTPAQIKTFPMFTAYGVGIWIITDPDKRDIIFNSPNWQEYLK